MADKVKKMSCRRTRAVLAELLAGELAEGHAASAEAHLADCDACRAERDALAHVLAGARAVGVAEPPAAFDDLSDAVWNVVHGADGDEVLPLAPVVPMPAPRRGPGMGTVAVASVLVGAAAVFLLWIAVGAGLMAPTTDPPVTAALTTAPTATPEAASPGTSIVTVDMDALEEMVDLGISGDDVGFGPDTDAYPMMGELDADEADRLAASLEDEMADVLDVDIDIPVATPEPGDVDDALRDLSPEELRTLEETLSEADFDDLV